MSNRLAAEKSPYLLQHKDNPVDWWPWCEAAFAEARATDRPVLLSIGYATCHWCHVMERESFEDAEVARRMNDTFVNIKVDREERPDIDAVYMTVCQMLTGSGGWPLTIMMTADAAPFFAGTYIPRETIYTRVGMLELVPRVQTLWRSSREKLLANANQITAALNRTTQADLRGGILSTATLDGAFEALRRRFDAAHGGFGTVPKFPSPSGLRFLLRYWYRTGNSEALHTVERTMEAMYAGGIYDHVGFGFHRYSTDQEWKVPHFEKMLYDQALLSLTYTEVFQATGKEIYRDIAGEIITYVLRDMSDPGGAFYAAEDADSEGEEGKFYVWRESELAGILNTREFELIKEVYNTEPEGNFRDEATHRLTGDNILHRSLGTPYDPELKLILESIRAKLRTVRSRRIRPLRDDKILTDWNGLMIAALARAGSVFDRPDWTAAAAAAADFIQTHLQSHDRRLLHRWRDGDGAIDGFLDDYAYFISGLLELYTATFVPNYLAVALRLARFCLSEFKEPDTGAFFLTPAEGEQLLIRPSQSFDGATPSGNAVMMMNLLRLGRLTSDPELEAFGHSVAAHFAKGMMLSPDGFAAMLSALDYGLGPAAEVVIAGEMEQDETHEMIRSVRRAYTPNVVLVLHSANTAHELADIVPNLSRYRMISGKTTAYVCQGFQCQAPTQNRKDVLEQIARMETKGKQNPYAE